MHQLNLWGSIGPFSLNTSFYPHLEQYDVITYTPCADDNGIYTIDQEFTSLYTKDGIIKGIACRHNCSLHGMCLIGLEVSTALVLLKGFSYELEHVVFADGSEQEVYCFAPSGLQLWVDDDRKVVKVFLGELQ